MSEAYVYSSPVCGRGGSRTPDGPFDLSVAKSTESGTFLVRHQHDMCKAMDVRLYMRVYLSPLRNNMAEGQRIPGYHT